MKNAVASKQFSLGWRDILRGLIMAVLTPVVVIIQQSIESGVLTFNWKTIGISALAGGAAYIIKNVFEPAKVILKVSSNIEAERKADQLS